MAQPPDVSETFLREVDENLRRDRIRDFFKDNANVLIGALLLFLLASGGFIWWKQHQHKRAEAQVEQLAQIYKDIGAGNTKAAPVQLDELADKGTDAVRASALFTRAALALQTNDQPTALAKYKEIAGDKGLPQPYRDAALIRQTSLEFDKLQPEEVISRMQPLAKAGEPWFGTAGEITALALIKQGKKDEAGRLFVAIAKDQSVPEAIRGRAVQVASSLGVDASGIVGLQAQ